MCVSLLSVTVFKNSWETVGKKRSLGKEGGPSETKESREKKGGEREVSRGRGGSNRRGRGISRGREGKGETKDVCHVLSVKVLSEGCHVMLKLLLL